MKKLLSSVFFVLFIFAFTINCFAFEVSSHDFHYMYTDPNNKIRVSVPYSFTAGISPGAYTGSFYMVHRNKKLSAEIISDRIEDRDIDQIREYIGDKTSGDPEIFNLLVQFNTSYYTALKQSYDNSLIYGSSDPAAPQTHMKVFGKMEDKLFGEDSVSLLYNTISSSYDSAAEDTTLALIVPSYINRTIYTFKFNMEKGILDEEVKDLILQVLKSVDLSNMDSQDAMPQILLDTESTGNANKGIYPDVNTRLLKMAQYENKTMGFRVLYPSSYTSFRSSGFMDSLQYLSFKINPYTVFSVQSERIDESKTDIQSRINSIGLNKGENVVYTGAGVRRSQGDMGIYINYEYSRGNIPFYVTSMLIKRDSMMYTLELTRVFEPAKDEEFMEFFRIFSSFSITEPKTDSTKTSYGTELFREAYKRYEFRYPENWQLTKEQNSLGTLNIYTLKNPDFSSALTIEIHEDQLSEGLESGSADGDILNKLSSPWTGQIKAVLPNARIPYESLPYAPLTGEFQADSDTGIVQRLVNYIDENNRPRLMYSKSLLYKNRVYTMYIGIGEYALDTNSNVVDQNFFTMINQVSESFKLLK